MRCQADRRLDEADQQLRERFRDHLAQEIAAGPRAIDSLRIQTHRAR
jgi:hypothetical protein